MGINRLLKKARTTHPAIGWLYLLAALIIHSCAFATSSVAQQGRETATTSTAPANDVSPAGQGGAVDSSAGAATSEAASNKEKVGAPISPAEPAPSVAVSSTIPPSPPPPQLSDRRYQDLLQQFLSLKDKLYKAELAKGPDRDDGLIRQLNAQIAEVQAQLEVLDQEKKAAGEVNEFLKDRLRKTESDLETVSKSGGIEKIKDLQSENASLQTELTKLKLDLDQMEKVRRESSQVPREIQEQLHRAEEEIRRSNLSTDERSKALMEENQSLKNKLVDLQQQFQAQMAALQNEKKSNSETAEALHSKLEKAETHLNAGSSTGDPSLDAATNENNSLKTEVSKLREELRLQGEIYEKEKKANEQIARVLKDQLERAEKQLNFARTERPDDARYEALRTKNLHLRSELDRVRNLFAKQLEDLEKDKRNLTDSSRALAERLQQAESELRIARTTPPAPTYAQTPVIQVEQQPVPSSIPATQVIQQASPQPGSATSVAAMPPDGAPEIAIRATPVTLEPDQPADSRKAESRSELVRAEAPAELESDSAVASRIGDLEEQLKEISSRTDSRFQALLDQQKAIRSDVGRIASREPGIVDSPGRPSQSEGETPSALSERLARIEEGLKNLDTEATLIKADNAKLQTQLEVVEKEKRIGAEAVNSVHQRLKTAEAQLAEGGSADLSKIQAQIEDLNKVKTMSAEVVGVLHQRLRKAEGQISEYALNSEAFKAERSRFQAELEMLDKEKKMSAEVAKVLHERLKKTEQQLSQLGNDLGSYNAGERIKAEAFSVLNQRLKKAETDLQQALASNQSLQQENNGIRDDLARVQSKFDSLDGGARRPEYITRNESLLPPANPQDARMQELMRENEMLRMGLARPSLPPQPEIPMDRATSGVNDLADRLKRIEDVGRMQDSNYEKLQKLLRENAELKAKINEVADRQRAVDPDETSSIRSELERLRRQLESQERTSQQEFAQTYPDVPLVTPEDLQRVMRENQELIQRIQGGASGPHGISAGDEQLLQRLLRENDELRHRLGDMETRLTKITQLTGTLKLDREALNASRDGGQLRSTMEPSYGGTVTLLKSKGNFAILKFPQGRIPPPRTKLDVFRDGILVGTVQITNPVKPPLASADIISGSLRIGDEVR